jgi:sialidase-1
VTSPSYLEAGTVSLPIVYTTGTATISATSSATITGGATAAIVGARIYGERYDAGRDLGTDPYAVGDAVPYAFHVYSVGNVTESVVPQTGNLAPFIPPGTGNCRYLTLAVGADYLCSTPKHTVTAAELAQGYFIPQTTWEVTGSGAATQDYTVTGDEVDLLVRKPSIAVEVTAGSVQDVDHDGFDSVGDTIAYTTTVTNDGNVSLTDVAGVPGLSATSLAVGASATATQVHTLTAADVAAGSVPAYSVGITAANGSKTVDGSGAAGAVALHVAPVWNAKAVYTAGDKVAYGGSIWEAAWWTQNQRPGDPYGPWEEIATTADGTALWTASRIFLAGDKAVYHGVTYTAKWWTRDQAPGDPYGPWAR